nr:MAG TPA: hypothetical protein [Caudoviricetes sp.]
MRAALNGALTRILPKLTRAFRGKTGGKLCGETPPGVVNRQHLESLPFRQNLDRGHLRMAFVLSTKNLPTQ